MTGKERITLAFAGEKTDRVPWVPFVGCHAGQLIGRNAESYLKSADHIEQGVGRAVELYRPDGIPVMFDLQIEAETLGCELAWAEENPPAVVRHPLGEGKALDDLVLPGPGDGRIGITLDATRRLRKNHPDLALYGLITGPFTLALHLLGTDIFMKMFDAPQEVHDLLEFCRDVGKAMSRWYIEAGCDVVALVDPMTSQIGPEQFEQYVTPYVQEIFQEISEAGALSSFFVCGHAQQNIPVMARSGCGNISIDENIPLEYVREECRRRGISFGGNLQLTSVLLLGKPVDAQKNALACLDVAGEEGFILAPGCDLPYATPPENVQAVAEIVHDEYQREVVRRMATDSADEDRLDLVEYGQADKVVVDIITLDSEACAPCQYMTDAVKRVAPEFEGIVIWREHKIKYRESLVFMTSLMVRNVPTICIDGEIVFVSRIPPRDELIAAIQKRINEKFRLRIQQRKAVLYLMGDRDERMQALRDNVEQAMRELGATDVAVEHLDDEEEIARFGVARAQTPAVVMARYQLKSLNRLPEVMVIKEWLKNV